MHPLTNWTTGLAVAAVGIVVGCESQEDVDERLVPVPESLRAPADTRDPAPQTRDDLAPAPQRLNDNTIDVGGGAGLGGTAGGVDAETRERARQEIRDQTPDVERRRDTGDADRTGPARDTANTDGDGATFRSADPDAVRRNEANDARDADGASRRPSGDRAQ